MTKTLVTNNKMQYGKILEECKNGNFEITFDYITENLEGQLDSKKALNILIACCNACVYCKETISEDYLLRILKILSPILIKLKETDIVSYVQSLYHFIKFFIHKGQLEYVITIEDIAQLPTKNLSKKLINTYNNIARLLHNVVAKSVVEDNICNEILFKISRLMLRISIQLGDSSEIANLSLSCFKHFCIKLSVEYQIDYYKEILDLLAQHRIGLKTKDIERIVINLTSHLLHSIINTYDFEKGLKFLNEVNSKLINVLNSEKCQQFQQGLQICFIFPCRVLKDKFSEINKCMECMEKIDQMDFEFKKDFVSNLSKMLQILKEYYTNINPKEWVSFSEDVQLLFFKCIVKVDSFLHIPEIEGGNVYFSNANVMFSLIKNANKNISGSLKYHQECVNLIKIYLKFINDNKNTKNWPKYWNNLAAEIYNIGIHLVQQDCNETAKYYFCLIINNFIKSEDRKTTIVLKYNILKSVCALLIQIYAKDGEKCLGFISLGTILCPESRDSFMTNWITTKYNLKEKAQKLNLVTALDVLEKEIPALKLDVSEKQFLLCLELDNYKKKWKSKVPIVSVIKELRKISDNDYVANVIVNMFADIELPHNEELSNIVADVLNKHKNDNTNVTSQINLAILYYTHYRYCNKKIIAKNAEDMENTASVVPMENEPDLNDPKDACDVTSSYESLHVEVYRENLKNIEKSLSIFTTTVPLLKTDKIEYFPLNKLYNILVRLSSEFKLLCYKLKAVQALEAALKIAQLQNDSSNIIKAIGLILEHVDESTEELLKMADDLIENGSFSEIDHVEICITYYINKSKHLLYNDFEESYRVFKKAENLLEQVKDKNCSNTLRSRLFLLNSQFSKLPCNIGIETHKKSILMNAYLATEIMYEEYRNNTVGDPYTVSLLIEANKELVNLYHRWKCPKEVRVYAKEILLLTQKLVLPLQTVSYLTYLAHADLLSNYREDCQVKVKDIGAILGCRNKEIGQAAKYVTHSPSSPSFTVPSFRIPNHISHENKCDCYYCVCYEYQIFALENARLSALFNVKERNTNLAQEFFQSALNLYDSYIAKYLKSNQVVPDFMPTYGYILLNYSSHLWRTNRKSEARDFNKTLLTLLEPKKLQNVDLYNEALLQKLSYTTDNIVPAPVCELQLEMDQLQISDDKATPKTPENNRSEVSVLIEKPTYTSVEKNKMKKFPVLTFSPSDLAKENANVEPIIKIYSRSSVRKTKTKTTSQTPVPTFPENSTSGTVTESVLRTRTKLLTEKLKQSSKKTEPSTSGNQIKKAGEKCSTARKNLLKELSAPESTTANGAIRRSTRTRK
ncbi:uncharacterized protein LOC130898119 [Diorhabda carinulata]|uniref:uncharacterized protein LOC130898119 n=1 Tax=Diorhabda carinulata TaxID=1163345 RepID=UPI0025A12072|nr:uncharacterized protein LOC130898119 [Diorhabda carinulata]